MVYVSPLWHQLFRCYLLLAFYFLLALKFFHLPTFSEQQSHRNLAMYLLHYNFTPFSILPWLKVCDTCFHFWFIYLFIYLLFNVITVKLSASLFLYYLLLIYWTFPLCDSFLFSFECMCLCNSLLFISTSRFSFLLLFFSSMFYHPFFFHLKCY